MQPATLHISSTWNGLSIPSAEIARISLNLGRKFLEIEVDSPFHDDPPPLEAPGSLDGLWNFEVVEVFIADRQGVAYSEVELSPWGHFLGLRFVAPRVREGAHFPVSFDSARTGDRWSGRATIDRRFLPADPCRANAFAIHGLANDRRYLAAAPLPTKVPDFHRPADFPRIFATTRPASEPD